MGTFSSEACLLFLHPLINPDLLNGHDSTGSRMEDQEFVMMADADTLLTDESESELDDAEA